MNVRLTSFKRAAIIQPGKIGDIVICLPMAKYLVDRGFQVIWPIDQSYLQMFESVVDYVTFLPIPAKDCNQARELAKQCQCALILNIGFGQVGNEYISDEWMRNQKLSFDKYKYELANIPFEEKFKLQINRNHEREESLFKKLVTSKRYVVIHEQSSDHKRDINVITDPEVQKIYIQNQSDSIFDWIKIFENAEKLYFVDSCMVNLCSGLGIKTPGIRHKRTGYNRPNDIDYPILTSNWATV